MKTLYTAVLLVVVQAFSFGAEHLKASFQSSIGTETTEIEIKLDTVLKKAHFIISGPLDKYIGFGFGAREMDGSYGIACNSALGDVIERKFTGTNAGTALTPSVENVVRTEDGPNNRVRIEFDRNTEGLNADYYSFDFTTDTEIDFIYSLGRDKAWRFHGGSNFGITKLAFNKIITGINSSEKLTEVSMFPNPVQDVINVKLSSESAATTVKVLDMKGTSVLSKEFLKGEDLSLDVSSVKPGVYMLSVTKEGLRSGMVFQKL